MLPRVYTQDNVLSAAVQSVTFVLPMLQSCAKRAVCRSDLPQACGVLPSAYRQETWSPGPGNHRYERDLLPTTTERKSSRAYTGHIAFANKTNAATRGQGNGAAQHYLRAVFL
jgi:hypothetical protein